MLCGPFAVYVGDANEGEPRIDQVPPGADWTPVIPEGTLAESAVAVDLMTEYGEWKGADALDAAESWIAGRSLRVTLGTVAVDPDVLGRFLEVTAAVVAPAANVPGSKSVSFAPAPIGAAQAPHAVILRGRVSGADAYHGWFYCSHAVFRAEKIDGAPTRSKPMQVKLGLRSLGGVAGAVIRYREQTGAAT